MNMVLQPSFPRQNALVRCLDGCRQGRHPLRSVLKRNMQRTGQSNGLCGLCKNHGMCDNLQQINLTLPGGENKRRRAHSCLSGSKVGLNLGTGGDFIKMVIGKPGQDGWFRDSEGSRDCVVLLSNGFLDFMTGKPT